MTEEQGAPLDIKFQQRFSKNLISNVVYFVLNVIIGLALVPFFLDTLGEAAYGLIPLATSLTSYVTLIIDAVNGAISRYLTIDLQRGDITKANETFNTAVFGTLGIILILVPISLLVAGLAPSIFNIGTESPTAVFLLFALVFGSILIRAWSSNFMVTLFAYNRLDLRNYVNVANLLVQVVVVILLFWIIGPSLPLVGFSYFVAAVAALALSYILSRNLCPFLTISVEKFSKSRLREILSITGWTTIIKIGLLFQGHIALIAVNILFGDVAGTEYSLTLMWSALLLTIAGLLTNCFTPMIYSYRAKNNRDGIIKFTSFTVKITTLFMALLIGLVCIFASQLLTFWVGNEYAALATLMGFVVIPVIFLIQSSCCAPINAAYVRVRMPAIANIVVGVFNLILVFALPIIFNIGMYGIALAIGFSNFILFGGFSPIYGAYILKAPLFTFVKPALPGYLTLAVFLVAGSILTYFVYIDSIVELIIAGCIISGIYGLFLCKILLNKEERILIRSVLPKMVARFIPTWLL
ncbi:lipopolysaccharide biosynthesis protein [Methanocorpusculum parvum]|uniref:Polysaccharide biosynthesis protein n=1 Tax=Methanocorpusculum parvum TaxID=2193 RepID=A0AAX0Q7N7_9EURY|nr:lipopolysaccharide biosynthesis protein [Methanocorpusculum parvum]PAV09390.1 hypothetical protein ASJ83_07920 [Methanocorpusculum parvum]